MFFGKKHATFEWKNAISGFPVSPGSAEAIVRWGGKIKYILIAYFLGNICAKNGRNRTVHVEIIVSQRWDVFWDSVYCESDLPTLNCSPYHLLAPATLPYRLYLRFAAYDYIRITVSASLHDVWTFYHSHSWFTLQSAYGMEEHIVGSYTGWP